jgi:hypothetical protein
MGERRVFQREGHWSTSLCTLLGNGNCCFNGCYRIFVGTAQNKGFGFGFWLFRFGQLSWIGLFQCGLGFIWARGGSSSERATSSHLKTKWNFSIYKIPNFISSTLSTDDPAFDQLFRFGQLSWIGLFQCGLGFIWARGGSSSERATGRELLFQRVLPDLRRDGAE